MADTDFVSSSSSSNMDFSIHKKDTVSVGQSNGDSVMTRK